MIEDYGRWVSPTEFRFDDPLEVQGVKLRTIDVKWMFASDADLTREQLVEAIMKGAATIAALQPPADRSEKADPPPATTANDDMFRHAYDRVEKILDEALGGDDGDGAGRGIAGDVYLLMKQRDLARALLDEAIRALSFHDTGAAVSLSARAAACTAAHLMN